MRTSSVDQVILETLARRQDHLTSLQIYEEIRGRLPAVNQSTVYRALERLAHAGRVSVSDLGTGAALYELVGGSLHHHLICQQCGRMFTLETGEVEAFFAEVENRSGYRILTNHLILFGLCPDCQRTAGEPSGSVPAG